MPTNYANYNWGILKLTRLHFLEVEKQVSRIIDDFPDVRFDGESIRRKAPSTETRFSIDPFGRVKPYPFIDYYVGNSLKIQNMKDILMNIEKAKLPEEEEKRMLSYLTELGIIG